MLIDLTIPLKVVLIKIYRGKDVIIPFSDIVIIRETKQSVRQFTEVCFYSNSP